MERGAAKSAWGEVVRERQGLTQQDWPSLQAPQPTVTASAKPTEMDGSKPFQDLTLQELFAKMDEKMNLKKALSNVPTMEAKQLAQEAQQEYVQLKHRATDLA